jgi:hypothetical protein
MIAVCQNPKCRAEFEVRRGKGEYCSRSCWSCVNGFHASFTHENRARAAQTRAVTPKTKHKIEMICDGCGQTFCEYEARRPKPMKFCTRKCYLHWQQPEAT